MLSEETTRGCSREPSAQLNSRGLFGTRLQTVTVTVSLTFHIILFWAIGAEVPFVSTHVFLHSLVGLQADWWFITENRGLGSGAGGKGDDMRESPHWSQNNRRLQRDETELVLSCLVFGFGGLLLVVVVVYFGLDWENKVWHFVLSYFYPYVSTASTSVSVLASPSLNLHGATMF